MKKLFIPLMILMISGINLTSCTPEAYDNDSTVQSTEHGDSKNTGGEQPQDPPSNGEG